MLISESARHPNGLGGVSCVSLKPLIQATQMSQTKKLEKEDFIYEKNEKNWVSLVVLDLKKNWLLWEC